MAVSEKVPKTLLVTRSGKLVTKSIIGQNVNVMANLLQISIQPDFLPAMSTNFWK